MEVMLETIKYSFILPAYKAKFLKEAIDSILGQTYTEFELIIVNDASPEDLDAIVNGYIDKRIVYYKNETNIGGSDLIAQWNLCLAHAKGEYVVLASDDDIYSPEYLENMDILIKKYPQVNVFRPRVKRIDRKGKILNIDGYAGEHLSQLEYFYLWSIGNINSGIPFFIFKRSSLIAIGGFVNYPLAWFSDDATVMKLADNGIAICNKTLFTFRLANESISTAHNSRKSLVSKYRATKAFYDEHIEFIKNYIPKNDEEAYILAAIKRSFPKLIRRSKIKSQLKTSSFTTIVSTIDEGLKINCVNIFYILACCRYPIINSIKSLFAIRNRKEGEE